MVKYIRFFKNIFLFAIIISAFSFANTVAIPRFVHVTIFIHGSVFSGLSLLDLNQVKKDKLSDSSFYVSMVKNIRNNPLLMQDQILLKLGLHQIPQEIIEQFNAQEINTNNAKIAAYHIVPSYDALLCKCNQKALNEEHHYYAFGHFGLLSQTYRQEAARELYDALCNLKDMYKKDYTSVRFSIIAHSHGGNIALNLAGI